MKGKEKCRMLKQIRKQIADANEIPYVVEECPYQGECKGTCPKCEAELREMEKELSLRRRLGKSVAVAGVAAGIMASTTACTPSDVLDFIDMLRPGSAQVTDGDYPYPYITEGLAPFPDDMNYPKVEGEVDYQIEGGAPYYEDEVK